MTIGTLQQEIFIKPLVFDISNIASTVAGWNMPDKFFARQSDGVTADPNQLLLYIDHGKYQSLTLNQGTTFEPTGGPSFLKVALVRKGFRVRIDYEESIARHAVHLLAKYALENKCLITVKDYVGPEAGDIVTEVITLGTSTPRVRVTEESFTTRTGVIVPPLDNPGSIGDASPGGYSFTFQEKGLRFI